MILKGGPRGKGRELAVHLMRVDTNEKVRVFDMRGVFSSTVRGALAEMEAVAAGSRAKRPLYHVSLNPERDETLTAEQWHIAADRLEQALGMEGHQRVMVLHLKEGKDGALREHMHIAWCRADPETMKVAHHSHNYRTHEEVARSLEREFGLKRTQGVHAEREGEKPNEKRPNTQESQQEARTGWKKADAQAAILAAWTGCRNGAEFRAALEANGYRLAKGDERDYCVIDPSSGIHSIRSGIKGLRVAAIRERFADLANTELPSVAEAQKAARDSYAVFRKGRDIEQASGRQRSLRPTTPSPGRYDVLRGEQTKAPDKPVATRQPLVKAPQPTTTPPTWARDEGAPAPQKSVPVQQPTVTQPEPTAALRDLQARQAQEWAATQARIGQSHARAVAALDNHHMQRMATLTIDVDARLKELNGLTSRAGALLDPAGRNREIAYLVAKRQRSLTDEQARQEKVRDDLRRAHAREVEEAKAKHDRLAQIQEKALLDREARAVRRDDPNRTTPKPRDYDR